MTVRKRIVSIAALFAAGLVNIIVFWNSHLFYRAEDLTDLDKKIKVLQEANEIYPWNDRCHYELGKAYFASCIQNLSEGLEGGGLIQNSSESFGRSLRLNPASPFSHFYYAQSLLFENILTPSSDDRFYKEFKSAARLAGENREIMYQVGKKLLVCWNDLTDEDKDLVLNILKSALERKPVDKFPALLSIWEMNVKDVAAIERIIPENPEIYRRFGSFLGEKSFSLDDRQRILAQADFLQIESSKRLLDSGEREYESSRIGAAMRLFQYSLGGLLKIRFFHELSGKHPFSDAEFLHLFKSANLGLWKCFVESNGNLEESRKYLDRYLDVEKDIDALRDFEAYIRTHEIEDRSIQIQLYHRQGRYQEIVNLGDQWNPEESRDLYILGDSHQKIGKLDEAVAFFERAIEADPRNLQALLKIRQLYRDLEEYEKVRTLDGEIEHVLTQNETIIVDRTITRDSKFSRSVIFEGEARHMDLFFRKNLGDKSTLVTMELNGRVIWDDYLAGEKISLEIKPELGRNTLRVLTVNYPFVLEKIVFETLVP